MIRFLVLLVLLSPAIVHCAARVVTTTAGDEISVTVYAAKGDHRILWLPSEFGATSRRAELAQALAAEGIEVWVPDLHSAFFLPVGRYSLNDVDPDAVVALIDVTLDASDKPLYLMAEGRTTALALSAVRIWQTGSDRSSRLKGLLTLSPKLYVRTPQGGEDAEYLPIAAASNLPVYLFQPEESGAFWRVGDAVRELEKGGASIFLQRLPGVSDGFHARPEYSPAEAAMSRRLPGMLRQAITLLASYGGTPASPATMQAPAQQPQRPSRSTLLRPYPGKRAAPPMQLPSLDGGARDLAALRGQVVLVNFWATWCPPCVEEIPSLQRLYAHLRSRGLEILAIDVGESVETMRDFLADKPVDFPVLMDTDGEALRHWGIYAFPTTLVLDRQHRIRYAVFGAFDWSSDEVIETLIPLLNADDPGQPSGG